MSGAATGRLRSRLVSLIAVGVVLLAVLLTWLLGGLAPAPAIGVTRLPLGGQIELSRWTLVVSKLELADTDSYGNPSLTTLRLWTTATWHGDASTVGPVWGLGDDLIGLDVPGGPVPEDPSTLTVDGYSGGFDPGITRPLVLDFPWPPERVPYEQETQPEVPRVPATVDVVVHDEYQAPNLLFADDWRTTEPIGYVRVPVQDVRR